MENVAIKVKNLTKVYHLYDKPIDRLKESLNPFKKIYHHDFYAINNVSFEIKKGKTIGIIGKNGAGKSTLLKMITGVLTPTSGNVEVNGKIASLLELGAGFNPEMTGLENIYLNGTIMGFSKEEMDERVDAILEFSDIGEFIYQPVKMYSSGMFARLAFSVAINVNPDILIVDEALSVGDARFQAKCIRKMENIAEKGVTIVFVSHDMHSVKKFCQHIIWIDKGTIHESGAPLEIIKNFMSFMTYGLQTDREKKILSPLVKCQTLVTDIPMINVLHLDSFGKKNALIEGIQFIDKNSQPISTFIQGDNVVFICDFTTSIDLHQVGIGVLFKDPLNNEILTFNSYMYGEELDFVEREARTRIKIKFKVPKLHPREYIVTVALSEGTQLNHIQQHWIHEATVVNVQSVDHIDGCILSLYKNEIEFSYE